MRIIDNNVVNEYFLSCENNKTAFTLVELIMVMAIIAIVSVFSFGYFADFSSKQAINEDLSNLNMNIRNLDSKVRNMEIYDYKIILSTGSFAYTTYTNYYSQDYKQILEFDNNTFSGVLSVTGASMIAGTEFSYLVSADLKSFGTNNIDINSKYLFSLSDAKSWEINSTISGSTVNNIYFDFYSLANSFTGTNSANRLILTNIYKEENKIGETAQITIENINNKKFIKDQSGQIIDRAFLFFERAGKEISLEIK